MPEEKNLIVEIGKDPDVRKNAEAARELEPLKQSGAWLYLQKRFDAYPELVAENIAKRLLRGEVIDQRQLDFTHGYSVAISDIFAMPERVIEQLERAAERAWQRIRQEDDIAPGDDAPYV